MCGKIYMYSTDRPDRHWQLPSLPLDWYHSSFPWITRLGCDVDHSPPVSAEENSRELQRLTLYAFMAWTGITWLSCNKTHCWQVHEWLTLCNVYTMYNNSVTASGLTNASALQWANGYFLQESNWCLLWPQYQTYKYNRPLSCKISWFVSNQCVWKC
jgi:hypothetical protein